MKKLILFLFLLAAQLPAHSQTVAFGKGCLEADIILAVDWSGSVSAKREYMLQAIYAYSRSFLLSEDGIKLGVLSFGDETSSPALLTADTTVIDHGILQLMDDSLNHATRCDDVPTYASVLFAQSKQERGKSPQRKFLIVISDGDVRGKDVVSQEFRAFAEREGVLICTIRLEGKVDDIDIEAAESFMSQIAYPNYAFRSSYYELRQFLVTLNLCM